VFILQQSVPQPQEGVPRARVCREQGISSRPSCAGAEETSSVSSQLKNIEVSVMRTPETLRKNLIISPMFSHSVLHEVGTVLQSSFLKVRMLSL